MVRWGRDRSRKPGNGAGRRGRPRPRSSAARRWSSAARRAGAIAQPVLAGAQRRDLGGVARRVHRWVRRARTRGAPSRVGHQGALRDVPLRCPRRPGELGHLDWQRCHHRHPQERSSLLHPGPARAPRPGPEPARPARRGSELRDLGHRVGMDRLGRRSAPADPPPGRSLAVDRPEGIGGRDPRRGVRPQPWARVHDGAPANHVRRRCGLRRRQGRHPGGGRVPPRPGEVPGDRGPHPQGRAARRSAGDGEDAHRPRRRRGGGGAVHLGDRLALHGDVRRCRRRPGARPVRHRAAERTLDHLRRRDRLDRPRARRDRRREPRRARSDPQPAAGGDGRLRQPRADRGDGRHQPARHPRSSAPASRAVRPSGGRPAADPQRADRHPRGALSRQEDGPRHRPAGPWSRPHLA